MLFFNEQGAAISRPNILYGIDGIQSLAQWNASHWLLSAYRRGRSDIVSYDAGSSRYTPLTKDYADHTELFLSKENGFISYRSGYPADSIYHKDTASKKYGIYFKEINSDFKQSAGNPETLVAKDSAYIKWHQQEKGYGFYLDNSTSGIIETEAVSLNHLPVSNIAHSATNPWLKAYLKNLRRMDSTKTSLSTPTNSQTSFLSGILTPEDTKKSRRDADR